MAEQGRDLAFENVLSSRSADRRTALFVFPAVVILAIIVGFAFVAISRMSSLSTQVKIAQQQVDEASKTVEERDRQLREAKADVGVLSSPGQGAAVLSATAEGHGASGVALAHPEQHALNVYAFNLPPPPEGQEYRLVVSDAEGHESMLGGLAPDDRGAAFLLARDVPEGVSKLELALVAKAAARPAGQGARMAEGQPAPPSAPGAGDRQPVLTGELPRPGEAGVVTAAPAKPEGPKAQARAPGGQGRRRAR